MKKVLTMILATCCLGGAPAHAGAEVTPGNYYSSEFYADLIPGVDPRNTCIYILSSPSGSNGSFDVQMDIEDGGQYLFSCTRLSKGRVKPGKGHNVKEDRNKLVLCSGNLANNPLNIALIFQPKGKGSKARLRKIQVVGDGGDNLVLADAVQDTTNCPGPTPILIP